MEILRRYYRAQIRAIDAKNYTVDALISDGSVDRHGTIIEPTAWKKDIGYYKDHPVLVASHDHYDLLNQIGEAQKITFAEKGPVVKFKYYAGEGNEQADWGWKLAEKGMAMFSVGFIAHEWQEISSEDQEKQKKKDPTQVAWKRYTRAELAEVSQVVVGSNRNALQRTADLSGAMLKTQGAEEQADMRVISDFANEILATFEDIPEQSDGEIHLRRYGKMDPLEKLMEAVRALEVPIQEIKEKVDQHDKDIEVVMSRNIPGQRLPIPPAGKNAYRGEWPIRRESDSDNDNGEKGTLGKIIQAIYRKAQGDSEAGDVLEEFGVQLGARAMQEDEPSEGGFLLPVEHEPEILRIPSRGVVEPKCRRVPMGSKTRNIPKEGTSVTTYWVSEESDITASQPTLEQVTLTAIKQGGILTLSNELMEDSKPDVVEYLETLFAEAMMLEADAQILQGTGSPCSGLLTAIAGHSLVMASGSASFSMVGFDILSEAISRLAPTILTEAVFVLHPEILHFVRTLKDDSGAPIWSPKGGGPGQIYDHLIVESTKMPGIADDGVSTAFILFGNFRGFIIGDRHSIRILVDPYTLLEKNQSRIRWTRRIALEPAVEKMFCRILTAAS